MVRIKKYFFLFLLCFVFSSKTNAQVYRFEVSALSLSVKQAGKWSDFTPFKETRIVANLNTAKNYIAVYSDIEQYFTIQKYYRSKTVNGKNIDGFDCVDQNSESCYIEIQSKIEENIHQLYIQYRDRILVYNMKFTK